MNNKFQSVLYIIKEITLEPGLDNEYIKFLNALEKYIQVKYSKYYNSFQLYKQNSNSKFFMVISYHNIEGIYEIIEDIENDITNLYEDVYGNRIERKVILSFDKVEKLIPNY